VLSNLVQTPLTDSTPQAIITKESTPVSQPEITSSLVKPTIVIDAENNPFTAIIENGVEPVTDTTQEDAAEPLLALEESDSQAIIQEENPSGNLFDFPSDRPRITELLTLYFLCVLHSYYLSRDETYCDC
jgi:hypothetical protein